MSVLFLQALGFVGLWICGFGGIWMFEVVSGLAGWKCSFLEFSYIEQCCFSPKKKDPKMQRQNDSRGQKPEGAFAVQIFLLTITYEVCRVLHAFRTGAGSYLLFQILLCGR